MKRIVIVFIAIIAAIAFSSCEKEQLGMYNPKKKIHKIYQKTGNSEKKLTETWTWEGDKLMRVDIDDIGASIADIFEYDGKFMSKITRTMTHLSGQSVVGEFLFSYDGKKLTKIELLTDGVIDGYVTFLYEGNKISKMMTELSITKSSQAVDIVFSSMRYVLPAELLNILKETHKSMEKSTADAQIVLTSTLTWDGDNIKKVIAETLFGENVQIHNIEYSYDTKNNPFYGNYLGSTTTTITGAGTNGMTKNNPTKIVRFIVDEPYSNMEATYTYKYEGNYPVEVISAITNADILPETTYYEYFD